MKPAYQPTSRHLGGDELHGVISLIRGRNIVDREQNPGHELVDCHKKRSAPQRIEPIELGELAQEDRLPHLPPAQPFIKPSSEACGHFNLPK
jgi:hypothetical protein